MKRSFTLIELLISVMIFSLLFAALAKSIALLKNDLTFAKSIAQKSRQQSRLQKLLYTDLLNASSITIAKKQDNNFDHIFLHTTNSLYGIPKPYVLWYVSPKDHTLVRIESPTAIDSNRFYPYIDIFTKHLKAFKLYSYKKKYLLVLLAKQPLYFEFEK